MAISTKTLNEMILNFFPDAQFTFTDLVGDQDHYSLEISSSQFNGLSKIQQHKLVNKALESVLGTTLHALTIKIK